MVKASPLKPQFNAGELSPRLFARVDFGKYLDGHETFENLLPVAEGGAVRRPGTRYVAEVKDSSQTVRLRRFQFSTTQAYVIEMGPEYMRFCRNQGQITVPDTDAAISNGEFTSDITGWDDRSTGTGAISHDSTNGRLNLDGASASVAWAEQDVTTTNTGTEHVLRFRVLGAPGDYVQLRIGTTSTGSELVTDFRAGVGWHCYSFTPSASPFYVQFRNPEAKTVQIDDVSLIDNAPVEIGAPYQEGELFDVSGPQSADVLYLFHSDHPTYKLSRRGNTTWSLTQVAWEDGPYLTENTTSTTLTPSAATGLGITITASATDGINGGDGFQATDVGRLVRISNPASGTDWGYAVITGVTSTTVVTADVKRDFATTNAATKWALGAWSETTGYPKTGAFFEQRLVAANTDDQPQTFWMGQVADFENFAPDSPNASGVWDGTVEDDDALDYTIASQDVNAIRWISPGSDVMVIGTAGGEWVPKAAGEIITPTDIAVRPQTTIGSAPIAPLRVGHSVLFVQRAGRKIRDLTYSIEVDGFIGIDRNRLASHITTGGIVEMAYAQEPDSIIWAVRNDGQLLSMTYRQEEDVVAWSRHIIGGSFGSGNAVVESVTTIPGSDAAGQVQSSEGRDEVWLVVKRTINGATKRYIEFIEKEWDAAEDDQEDAYYSDSLITYDGAATTTITGLDHLEGETVKILADGAIHPDKTVSSGQVTLDLEASVVQIGLGYEHRLKTLKLDFGSPRGTAIGKKKRIEKLVLVFEVAHTFGIGASFDNLFQYDFREVGDSMDTAVPYFSGEWRGNITKDWDNDPRVCIACSNPVPFSLLAIAFDISVKEL